MIHVLIKLECWILLDIEKKLKSVSPVLKLAGLTYCSISDKA